MHFRTVSFQLGLLMLLLSASMLPAMAWGAHDWESGQPDERQALFALGVAMLIGCAVGAILAWLGRKERSNIGRREALILVASTWVLGAAVAALPFRIWGAVEDFGLSDDRAFCSYVNCYFEAMSGLTTTGASILTDIEAVPGSLLLWRSFIQWLGGLGIVVLFVAVLPMLGVGGKRLFRVEIPGVSKAGVRPRIREAAQTLWLIYLGITVAQVLLLKLGGMSWFDGWCHAFTTMATGGFGTRAASIGAFPGVCHVIIIVFMIAAGVNFSLYYRVVSGRWRDVWSDAELRTYLGIIVISTLVVVMLNAGRALPDMAGGEQTGPAANVLQSLFHVVSMQTTTGYAIGDFDRWPVLAKVILLALMFVGASAGSTGGGIKVVRWLIAAKVIWAEIETVFRPHVIRPVRIGKQALDPGMYTATLAYVVVAAAIFVLGSVALLALEHDQDISITTAVSATAATMNNIGPGFDTVGATRHYQWFSAPSKVLMSFLMAFGRLELYTFLVLLAPRFWQRP
jgi:trk system potassium uptake protein TrkH